jgi:hypothetical protein
MRGRLAEVILVVDQQQLDRFLLGRSGRFAPERLAG